MDIYGHQIKAFERVAWQRFEVEMLEHSQEFSPHLSASLGEERLLVAVRGGIVRASAYGFTNRGPIRLFLELMLLCGSSFDSDPQYPAVGDMLRDADDQMIRAERMHAWHNAYVDRVSGAEDVHEKKALMELGGVVGSPVPFMLSNLETGLRRMMKDVFPQKYSYVGDDGITKLIDEGKGIAAKYGLMEAREITLIVLLMFAFGHGCTNDPLYPWIADTLNDEELSSAESRARRLEKKAQRWLSHLLLPQDELVAAYG